MGEKALSVRNRELIKDFVIITIGTIIVASAVFFFLVPSHLSVGSVSGLAIIISGFTHIPVSVITMVLNVLFLILGFLLIGKEFGAKTVYTSILLPIVIGIYEIVFPNFQSIMEDPFLDMLCYCLVVSIGLALLFIRNASSGGLDIAAKILNKFLRMDLGKAMTAAGICVALSSALLYDKKTVVLSLIGTYLNGIVLDNFIFGISAKKKVCILSEKNEEIRSYIIHELHSGATLYNAIGGFDFQPHQEIAVIVDKNEYSKLMSFILKTDKNAFITVYTVNEIIYRPKK
jgi:uncharacterized membrane-anchored protein YitT (DUF2179 family)